MGIDAPVLPIVRRVVSGVGKRSMLMYGVQDINFVNDDIDRNFSILKGCASKYNLKKSNEFFKLIGFENVYSLDISNEASPDYIENLNNPVSTLLHNRFDFIYDGGTLEHVFNVKQSLENGVKMLCEDGVIFHHLPMNGLVNHGFYQFCPNLFFDYYLSNSFVDCAVYFYNVSDGVQEYGFRDIIPKAVLRSQTMLSFVARKTALSTTNDPMQFMYSANTAGLSEALEGAPFYIWGTGGGFVNNYLAWFVESGSSSQCLGFIDSNPEKAGSVFHGHAVYHPSRLMQESQDPRILVASTYYPEIEFIIEGMGLKFRLVR